MKRVLIILICLAVFAGCGKDDQVDAQNTSQFADENTLTLEDANALLENYVETDQINSLPREQVGSNRGEDDPVEYAYTSDKKTREEIFIGIYLNSEDAQVGFDDRKVKQDENLSVEQQKVAKLKRTCNVLYLYHPGSDLANPVLLEKSVQIQKDLTKLCKTGKVPEKQDDPDATADAADK